MKVAKGDPLSSGWSDLWRNQGKTKIQLLQWKTIPGAIALGERGTTGISRSKRIDIKFSYFMDLMKVCDVKLNNADKMDIIADYLTKFFPPKTSWAQLLVPKDFNLITFATKYRRRKGVWVLGSQMTTCHLASNPTQQGPKLVTTVVKYWMDNQIPNLYAYKMKTSFLYYLNKSLRAHRVDKRYMQHYEQ